MASTETTSALGRKLAAGREGSPVGGRSVLGALRLAMARAAADLCDLPLAVIGATQARVVQEEVGRFLADDRLLVLLDGPDGQIGAASLDAAFVTALIQQQTMGQVSPTVGASERDFTGTDAALVEPLIGAMLTRAVDLAEQPDDRRCLSGYRFGARAEDVRTLLLTLEANRFRVFELTIDIAGGVTQGAVCLVLPDLPEDPVAAGDKKAGKRSIGPGLDQAFGTMRAELTAMICRLRIPLNDLSAMQPGEVIPLVRRRLEETELVSINGQSVAIGRLGQVNGLRALRLNETRPDQVRLGIEAGPDFATHIGATGPQAPDLMPGSIPESITVDGTVVPPDAPANGNVSQPTRIDGNHTGDASVEDDDTTTGLIQGMSVAEAAAEISELAGLTLEDAQAVVDSGVD